MRVTVRYFAALRAERGETEEKISTTASTARGLYRELAERHGFTLQEEILLVSINRVMSDLDATISEDDEIVFIPPVAGG